MKTINVGLLGCGVVGTGFVDLVRRSARVNHDGGRREGWLIGWGVTRHAPTVGG